MDWKSVVTKLNAAESAKLALEKKRNDLEALMLQTREDCEKACQAYEAVREEIMAAALTASAAAPVGK